MKPASRLSRPVFIGASVRTPIGKFGGTLKRFPAPRLAALALAEALKRAPDAPQAEFVFVGHARQASAGPNPARQAAVFAGLPPTVPAITLNQACASGMTAIFSGIEKILAGKARSIWAGGVESMSNTPYLMLNARWGLRMGNSEVLDGMHKDGFFCHLAEMVMGETVERFIAQERKITRAEQDQYALQSQQRADEAWKRGDFASEVFEIAGEGKVLPLKEDEHRRADTSLASLAKLPAVFDSKSGTLTAGNSSGITDGAAFMHLSDQKLPHSHAEILDYETVALDPRYMGLGPVAAIGNMLKRNALEVKDIEVFEINEAFAAQALACQRDLGIPNEKLNPRGGAIALGHPIGASGARITVTLLSQLKSKPGALGIASLCVSGGQGVALLIRSL